MPPYGAKMGPEGGSTKASATEALLLPGARVEDRRRPSPDMAPRWAQKVSTPAEPELEFSRRRPAVGQRPRGPTN